MLPDTAVLWYQTEITQQEKERIVVQQMLELTNNLVLKVPAVFNCCKRTPRAGKAGKYVFKSGERERWNVESMAETGEHRKENKF